MNYWVTSTILYTIPWYFLILHMVAPQNPDADALHGLLVQARGEWPSLSPGTSNPEMWPSNWGCSDTPRARDEGRLQMWLQWQEYREACDIRCSNCTKHNRNQNKWEACGKRISMVFGMFHDFNLKSLTLIACSILWLKLFRCTCLALVMPLHWLSAEAS